MIEIKRICPTCAAALLKVIEHDFVLVEMFEVTHSVTSGATCDQRGCLERLQQKRLERRKTAETFREIIAFSL